MFLWLQLALLGHGAFSVCCDIFFVRVHTSSLANSKSLPQTLPMRISRSTSRISILSSHALVLGMKKDIPTLIPANNSLASKTASR